MAAQLQPDSRNRAAKRSRSSDHTPAPSTSSERINGSDDDEYYARLPAFLRLSPQDIEAKFEEIVSQQSQRLKHGDSAQNADSPWLSKNRKENRPLDRYSDIWPWDQTRVKLKVPEGHSDYINASSISLSASTSGVDRKYIATQGPKPSNVNHFWQMVWQETQSPAVLVMLTQLTEAMREKCFQYFPEDTESGCLPLKFVHEDKEVYEGSIEVSKLEVDEECKTIVREITLIYNGCEKKIWHLFFQAWPDHGVPQHGDRNALFSLIRLSREKNEGWSNPRIVHCSAGVGRTGTFIALEHLIDELDQGHFDQMITSDEDPIFDTVNELREQRMTMVQSQVQYAFLYDSLANAFRRRLREQDGRLTPLPQESSGEKLSHGEPSPKAIRLSRSLRKFLTEAHSRSSSRRRERAGEANEKPTASEKTPPSSSTSSASHKESASATRQRKGFLDHGQYYYLLPIGLCMAVLAVGLRWYFFPWGGTLISL